MTNFLRRWWRSALTVMAMLLITAFVLGFWSMGGSHTYHSQALVYLDSAQKVLVAHGLCRSSTDCVKREILFGDGGSVALGPIEFGGVQLQVYEVSDAEVVGDLVKALGETYKKLKGPTVTMLVYETKHLDSRSLRFASLKID